LRVFQCHKQLRFFSQYCDVEKAFLLFQESAFMLRYLNRFKQYSIHSLTDIFRPSNMVWVVGMNVWPHEQRYRWIPLAVSPRLLNPSEPQYGHCDGINELIIAASLVSLSFGCRAV